MLKFKFKTKKPNKNLAFIGVQPKIFGVDAKTES